jgi:hypothetical protein
MAIIVQSCDKYSDLWKPFYHFFHKNWPDNKFTVYHLSETSKLSHEKITDISAGLNKTWSEMLIAALKQIEQDYVLLLLEDYFLLNRVNNDRFYQLLSIAENTEAAFIRIFPVPGPDYDHPEFLEVGIIKKDSPYSISTQATIWNRKVLLRFLRPEESAWDLEIKGSKRAFEIKQPFLSLKVTHKGRAESGDYPFNYFCTAVYKGKWMKGALELCRREGIEIDLRRRRAENMIDVIYRKYYSGFPTFVKHIFDLIRARSQKF